MLNGLSLFTGIGGLDVALSEFVIPVAYCELNPYCQSVLLSRMQDGYLPKAPIWNDVRTLPFGELPRIDIITAGFPCQDISIAGAGKGLEGERSGLFFEIMRLVDEVRPKFLFLENVQQLIHRGGRKVIAELTQRRYDCRWCVIPASEVGSPQKRERFFCLAYSNSSSSRQANKKPKSILCKKETRLHSSRQNRGEASRTYWQKNKCPLLRMDYGLPFELERACAIGNSVCPEQAKLAFESLIGRFS